MPLVRTRGVPRTTRRGATRLDFCRYHPVLPPSTPFTLGERKTVPCRFGRGVEPPSWRRCPSRLPAGKAGAMAGALMHPNFLCDVSFPLGYRGLVFPLGIRSSPWRVFSALPDPAIPHTPVPGRQWADLEGASSLLSSVSRQTGCRTTSGRIPGGCPRGQRRWAPHGLQTRRPGLTSREEVRFPLPPPFPRRSGRRP